MPDLRSLAGTELQWRRTRWLPPAFRLSWNDQPVGSLEWERIFSSRAMARAGDGAWRFRRHGLRGILVEDPASGDVVASVRLHLFGSGEIELADGRHLQLQRASLLPPSWNFVDEMGSPLLNIRGRIAMLLRGGICRIEAAGTELPEAGMLALLGVYILVRRARRRGRSSGR